MAQEHDWLTRQGVIGDASGRPGTVLADPLHGTQDVFYAAVQMSLTPMVLADPHADDCPILFANRAFCDMTGYRPDEVVGRNCRFMQGPLTDPATVGQIRKAIADRWDLHVELINYRKDGSAFWNALFINPVFDRAGRLLYFFGTQLDVTRARTAEARLQSMLATGSDAGGARAGIRKHLQAAVLDIDAAARLSSTEAQKNLLARARWAAEEALGLSPGS